MRLVFFKKTIKSLFFAHTKHNTFTLLKGMIKVDIQVFWDTSFEKEFAEWLQNGASHPSESLYRLYYQHEKAETIHNFYDLQSLRALPHLTFFKHQIDTCRRVIHECDGKAILADEVGLGKTIEAGLILKELMIRKLVKKVLILTPSSLVKQWVSELTEKFHIPIYEYQKKIPLTQQKNVIMSLDFAKRKPYCDELLQQSFDMIIIDEAHKLKNPKTKNYQFVKQLKKKFCLLLTATPIQNDIPELFYLVSLLKPGFLGNERELLRYKKKNPAHLEHLKSLVEKVMIRNRRKDVKINDIKRVIHTKWLHFSSTERTIYQQLTHLFENKEHINLSSLSILTLLREFCSSKEALYLTLEKMYKNNPLLNQNKNIEQLLQTLQLPFTHTKAQHLVNLLKDINDKVIIFTEYKTTQLFLQWFLQKSGIRSVPFNGDFKKSKRAWMTQLFENNAQVLIATESAAEGINLQFCHHLIHYDLPWNPMRLEQRIGRVHRIGQKEDVHIYYFITKETIEEKMYEMLHEKVELFEHVIGELDLILSNPHHHPNHQHEKLLHHFIYPS